jgi:hypothetical protein
MQIPACLAENIGITQENRGEFGIRLTSLCGVRRGSDRGQTGVRPGSDAVLTAVTDVLMPRAPSHNAELL